MRKKDIRDLIKTFLVFSLGFAMLFASNTFAASTTNNDYLSGEILVQLKPGAAASDRERVSSALGSGQSLLHRSDVLHIKISNGISVEDAVDQIKKDPAVLSAQPNYRYQVLGYGLPTSITDGYYTSGLVPAVPCNSVTGTGHADWY